MYETRDKVRYKHYRNKICTLIRLSKRRYYDTFFENNMGNMKRNPARNQWTFTSTEKKNLKVISALKDFNNRNKIIKEGSRIPNIINEHFATVGNRPQKHHLDYVDKCKYPISSFLFSKNYCQKYYLYRMINLMVYTPHLPNYSNVQVPS